MYIYVNVHLCNVYLCILWRRDSIGDFSNLKLHSLKKMYIYVEGLNNRLLKNSNYYYFLNDICSLFKMLKDEEYYQKNPKKQEINVAKILLLKNN